MQTNIYRTSNEGFNQKKEMYNQNSLKATSRFKHFLFAKDAHTGSLLDEIFDENSTSLAVQTFGSIDYTLIATAQKSNLTLLS